jgi:DNA polymerase III delta subunit
MAIIREKELLGLAKRGFEGMGGALLYGTDGEAIAEVSRTVQRSWSSGEVNAVESASLRNQQGTLLDLLSTQSLFGGRGLVIIHGAEDQHSGLLAPVVGTVHANVFLIVAGSLRKSSLLRGSAEAAARCAVLALHEEAEAAQLVRIRSLGTELGFAFGPGAAERLLELCGGNRSLVAAEAAKLSLLKFDDATVSRRAIEENCSDQAESDFDGLFQSVLEGDLAGADEALARASESGELAAALPMLQSHLARLAIVQAALEEGLSWEAAFQKPKPPIYFGQHDQMKKQLAGLTLESLLRLQRQVQQIVFLARRNGAGGDAVTARALLLQTAKLSGRELDSSR